MGWTFSHQHRTRTTTRKEFAEICVNDFTQSTDTHGNLIYQILDHSLNKDGLTMLACYTQAHLDYINAETPREHPRTTDDKFIIHLLLGSSDGEWGYKGLDCSCGISIPNCPKRIIDKYKNNNPSYERSLKLYEQGEKGHWAVETIKRWEQNHAEKQTQAKKDKSLREIMKQAFENGEVLVELQDGLVLIESWSEVPLTGRYLVTHIQPKNQYFTAHCSRTYVKIKYKRVTALIDKSTGNVLWGEPREQLKSA